MNQSKKILSISFDWKGLALSDSFIIKQKLERDGWDTKQHEFFIFSFGKNRMEKKENNFYFFQIKAPRFIPLCHLLALFCVPFTIFRKRFKADTVLISDVAFVPAILFLKLFLKIKIFLVLNNMPTNLARTRNLAQFRTLYNFIMEICWMRWVDCFFTINNTVKDYILKRGVEKERIVIFTPNTILPYVNEINTASGEKITNQACFKEKKIIFSVGRLEKEKGFEKLISAFALLKDENIVLVIAGEGSMLNFLKQHSSNLKVEKQVFFVGQLSRQEIWSYYKASNVFMLLSSSEALGLVFYEAMYMSVAVIGTPIGGIKETIGTDGERGYFWDEAYGIEDLKLKLNNIFKNNSEVVSMINRARIYVLEKLLNTNNTKQYLEQQ